jgi:hypothetical protein
MRDGYQYRTVGAPLRMRTLVEKRSKQIRNLPM